MTFGMIRVSAIVPCFNTGRYVAEALDSVLRQTHAAHEIIVVDDGSTDDSAEVVAGYGERVRYVRQANQGIGAARNHGLSLVTGDWVAFLDADDLWPADSLAARAAIIEAEPVIDFVFGLTEEFLNIDGNLGALTPARAAPVAARVAGAALIRKRLFDELGGFDASLTLGETIDWIARMADAGAQVRAIDHLVLRRRVHDANTVRREVASQSDYLKVLRASLARRSGRAAAAD